MKLRAACCVLAVAATEVVTQETASSNGTKTAAFSGLPPTFAWGVATAAYQIEGGAKLGGRGPSIWDTFSHIKGKTKNGDTGDVACDHYHLYKSDIAMLASLGIRHYRLSLSWSRLMPDGRGPMNKAGVEFYTKLLAELTLHGIEPMVTLYHWDMPQALEDEYGGWLDKRVVKDFANYADSCFELFAPYVSSWITFNEALTFIGEGYGDGVHAPGRCSDRSRCAFGDSDQEPLIAAHHVLLSHGAAVAKFRERFATQAAQKIGMTNCGWMSWPLRPDHDGDLVAAQDIMEASWGWFFDPVIRGKYPKSMVKRVGKKKMPEFTKEESALLTNSIDFLGVNYYTARWLATPDAEHEPTLSGLQGVPYLGGGYHVTVVDDTGVKIGPQAGPEWLYVAPKGLGDVLRWLNTRYPRTTGSSSTEGRYDFKITENGVAQPSAMETTLDGILHDSYRIQFLEAHIREITAAYRDGVDVSAYYAWSLMDNYEWADGYTKRFGIVYVDYNTQIRTLKDSAKWYSRLIQSHPDAMRLGRPNQPDQLALVLGGGVLALLGAAACYRRYVGRDFRRATIVTHHSLASEGEHEIISDDFTTAAA